LGVDFIICDHHLPGAELPAAVAVLDPKRPIANILIKNFPAAVLALS
jgi:single-stranded DNA-specific DHH superfamily exonuclease